MKEVQFWGAGPLLGSHKGQINLLYNHNNLLKILIFFLHYSLSGKNHTGLIFPLSWNLISLGKSFQGQNEGSQGQSPPSSIITGGEREGLRHYIPLVAPVWSSLRI